MGALPNTSVEAHEAIGIAVLVLNGEHDINTVDEVDDRLRRLLESGASVVVDLSHADFIESRTVGAIVGSARLAAGRLCVVACAGTLPARVLDLTGVSEEVPTCQSVALAVERLRSPG